MDLPRWTNTTRARHSYEAASVAAAPYPLEAFFETAARCNLRCQMCAINYDTRYRPRSGRPPFLEPDVFERLRPIFPTLLRAYLFGLGEPTLNRHLVDYVRELKSHGVEVWFNTNGTLIDEEKAEALAVAGADRITVSIDGATAETYETIRRGARFDAVVRGIRSLVEAERRHGRPRVDLSFVAMAGNIGELPRLVDLAAELGARGVHVEPLYHQDDESLREHYERENLARADGVDLAIDEAAQRARDRGVMLQSRLFSARGDFDYVHHAATMEVDWTCSEPWASIWVTSAGEVRTCCTNEVAFGNLFEQSIEEIWNGEAFRRFRGQHVRRETADGCGTCVRNGRVRHSPYFRTLEPVTYRPLFRDLPGARAAEEGTIDWPRAGTTVTDPLIVIGRLAEPSCRGEVELMIDRTPVGRLREIAFVNGESFALSLQCAFVSEGAHVLWLRRRGAERGFGHREVFLWRPDVSGVRLTDRMLVAVPREAPPARLRIGGNEWPATEWRTMRAANGMARVGIAELGALAPGEYEANVEIEGRSIHRFPFARVG